ncbi:MAG: 3-ketoacyl-ACP reductase [Verrucomicrobiota bacterium]
MSTEPLPTSHPALGTPPKAALITGGSRGIGLGIALALAKEGHRIAINGMRPENQVAEVLEQLKAAGAPEVLYCQGDVGSAEGRAAILDRIHDDFGDLHILVNNAGVAPAERKDVLETTTESYQRVMGINLEGPYFLTQSVANWMVEQKQTDASFMGSIININSISATVASVNRGEYCVSKAGLAMVTQLFAARLGEFGIPVYEVRPGVTRTDMTSGVTEKYDKLIADGLCVTPRWGQPEDVGKAVASLARGDFPYSTGQTIMVDGGLTLPRL